MVVKVHSNNFYPCLQRVTNFVIGIMKLDVIYSSLAQLVEQLIRNEQAVGSSPTRGSIWFLQISNKNAV